MNLLDWLTCTQVASWSDKKRALQLLQQLLPGKAVATLQKVYLLGYVEARTQTVMHIASCVQQKSGRCLRQVFQRLPYGEDELGPIPLGPICTVYLLIEATKQQAIVAIGSTELGVSPPQLLLFTSANGLPHWLFMRKQLLLDS